METLEIKSNQFMAWDQNETVWVSLTPDGSALIKMRERQHRNPPQHRLFGWDEAVTVDLENILSALDSIDSLNQVLAEV